MKNMFTLVGCCFISAAAFATTNFSAHTPGKGGVATAAVSSTAPVVASNTAPTEPNLIDICHKGRVISVDANAVPAHLAHGDKVGSCAGAARVR